MKGYVNAIIMMVDAYRKLLSACETHQEFSAIVEETRAIEADVDIVYVMNDILALLSESNDGVNRIKKIVHDLKDFAHPGSDKPVYTNINMNMDMTLNVVWNELKYKVTVEKDYDTLPDIACYPQQLSQVFANILVNAAHAIEVKGVVTIRTRDLKDHVEVTIKDTGVGIPEKNLSRIFEPFFTTKDVGKGTGLGMHVAYSIIEKHHGTIHVESKVGEGTTFTISLPMEQP
jgi:signal transduction histidine kinase